MSVKGKKKVMVCGSFSDYLILSTYISHHRCWDRRMLLPPAPPSKKKTHQSSPSPPLASNLSKYLDLRFGIPCLGYYKHTPCTRKFIKKKTPHLKSHLFFRYFTDCITMVFPSVCGVFTTIKWLQKKILLPVNIFYFSLYASWKFFWLEIE